MKEGHREHIISTIAFKMNTFDNYFSNPAEKMSELGLGLHHMMGMRVVETVYGGTYIVLIGENLQPYWANEYVKKCLNVVDLNPYEDENTGYFLNDGKAVASLEISESKGKHLRSYKFKLMPKN